MYNDIGEEITSIHRQLLVEETHKPIHDFSEIALRQKERQELRSRLESIRKDFSSLYARFKRLPILPDSKSIRWAQSVLALADARLFTVDIDCSAGDEVLLRIVLLDLQEKVLFDQIIAPGYILSTSALRTWGMKSQELQNAHSLPQIWNSLLDVLLGKFIVCYDLERVRMILEKQAGYYQLEVPVILGDSLAPLLFSYFRATGYSSISALCQHIGVPLPEPPDCTIVDRALGQLHLLRTMAQGKGVHEKMPAFLQQRTTDEEEFIIEE